MMKDMLRFNRSAAALLRLPAEDPRRQQTLQEYLTAEGYSDAFTTYYVVPMCAALWSSSAADVLGSSAYAMIAFMDNHCMLQLFDRPQWKTVAGRSRSAQRHLLFPTLLLVLPTYRPHTCPSCLIV
jgi:predicted NAD/FAD-binding protein